MRCHGRILHRVGSILHRCPSKRGYGVGGREVSEFGGRRFRSRGRRFRSSRERVSEPDFETEQRSQRSQRRARDASVGLCASRAVRWTGRWRPCPDGPGASRISVVSVGFVAPFMKSGASVALRCLQPANPDFNIKLSVQGARTATLRAAATPAGGRSGTDHG